MKKHTLRFLILSGLFSAVLGFGTVFGNIYYVERMYNWLEARGYCRRLHTDLSSFHSEEEKNKLLSSRESGYPDFWTGLYQNDSGVWMWSGGKPVSVDIISTTDDNRCVTLNDNGWRRRNCTTEQFRFFCFDSNLVFVKENKTWEKAMEHCQSLGKNLGSLPSETGLAQFMQSCREAQTDYVWTGLRFLAGRWLWVDGKDMEYKAWSPRETPQCPGEVRRCGAVSIKEHNWVSQDCANKFSFVCI